jgi:hypothetical protein
VTNRLLESIAAAKLSIAKELHEVVIPPLPPKAIAAEEDSEFESESESEEDEEEDLDEPQKEPEKKSLVTPESIAPVVEKVQAPLASSDSSPAAGPDPGLKRLLSNAATPVPKRVCSTQSGEGATKPEVKIPSAQAPLAPLVSDESKDSCPSVAEESAQSLTERYKLVRAERIEAEEKVRELKVYCLHSALDG